MVQWDWWHPGSSGAQVQSLAQHSGLRIWSLGSDPWPGNAISHRRPKEKKKERKKKNTDNSFNKYL